MTTQEQIAQAIAGNQDLAGFHGTPDYQHTYYEDNGQPYWKKVGGGKMYIPPMSAMTMFDDPKALAWAKSQGYYVDGGEQGLKDSSQMVTGPDGMTRAPASPVHTASQSGGLFHTTGTWNSDSGKYESGLDWGNILTMVVAGVMTAGVATALMGGGAAADAAVNTALATGSADAGAAAGTAAAGGTLASTAGATGIGSIVPGVAASGGVEAALGGGAVAGGVAGGAEAAGGLLPSTSTASIGSVVPGVEASGDVGAALGGEGALLPSTSLVSNSGTLPNVASSGKVGAALGGGSGATALSTIDKISDALRMGGNAVGAATNAAGNNRLAQNDPYLKRSQQEMKERNNALADVYRNNWYNTRQRGPFDPKPLQQMSPEFMDTLKGLSTQGQAKLKDGPAYDTSKLPSLAPSTLEEIGSWMGPALTTAGVISKFL